MLSADSKSSFDIIEVLGIFNKKYHHLIKVWFQGVAFFQHHVRVECIINFELAADRISISLPAFY